MVECIWNYVGSVSWKTRVIEDSRLLRKEKSFSIHGNTNPICYIVIMREIVSEDEACGPVLQPSILIIVHKDHCPHISFYQIAMLWKPPQHPFPYIVMYQQLCTSGNGSSSLSFNISLSPVNQPVLSFIFCLTDSLAFPNSFFDPQEIFCAS